MKTTIPKPRTPDSGLIFTQGVWKCHFTRAGKRHYRSLRTTDKSIARDRRDALYASLRAAGATVPDTRLPLDPDDERGIYRVKPYLVRLHGVHVGNYETREEAVAAKREYLLRREGGNQ